MSQWNDPFLQKLFLDQTPLIDVRSPIEFADGEIPYSVNLPIMIDEERAAVGTTYKEKGQAAAIELGHKLVSEKIKEQRIDAWIEFLGKNPSAQIFCFRGGLRSQIACQWITEAGIERKPIEGGYKRLRNFFLSWMNEGPLPQFIRLAGPTGSGKTEFLQTLRNIDLEKLANHRGSSFGSLGKQPTQITFENNLALDFFRFSGKTVLIEDESATIGKIVLPKRLFVHLRRAPMVVLDVDKDERIGHIFETYVKQNPRDFFLQGLERIQKSLGGVVYQKIRRAMEDAFETQEREGHAVWIGQLLDHYYDPMYFRAIEKQKDLIEFRGNKTLALAFLKQRHSDLL
jgi:tRNA 2-selenouridine synthase